MKGCVLNLRMRDKQGSVVTDYSRYGNDGTVSGGVVWTERGMRFDGSSGYLDCGNDASLIFGAGDYSVSSWIKTSTSDNKVVVIHSSVITEDRWVLFLYEGKVFLYINDGVNAVQAFPTQTVNDNQWHHTTCIIDRIGNNIYIYIDGDLKKTADISTVVGSIDPAGTLMIGTQGGSKFFNGSIDQVRIYNRALPLREIKTMYNADKHRYI